MNLIANSINRKRMIKNGIRRQKNAVLRNGQQFSRSNCETPACNEPWAAINQGNTLVTNKTTKSCLVCMIPSLAFWVKVQFSKIVLDKYSTEIGVDN